MKPTNPTPMIKPNDSDRKWFVVDATGQRLGRLASRIAAVLRGKTKPSFAPQWDLGDFVVVINAEKIELSGRKAQQKLYRRHSGKWGNLRETTAGRMLQTHPERVIEFAVRGMLPKNRLGRKIAKKLKVYAGPHHPHAAQQPQPLTLE